MKLFDFQEQGVEDLIRKFKYNQSVCLSWYTGAGKTNVFIELCSRLIASNSAIKIGISSYFTTEIRDQVFERLCEFGLIGVSQKLTSGAPLQKTKNIFVFNPQMYRALGDLKFDLLIFDEGHAGLTPDCTLLREIIQNNTTTKTKKLIVSATPWDTLALEEFQGIPVLKRPLDLGLGDGLITDFKFFAEESKIKFEDSDFNRKGDLTIGAIKKRLRHIKSACHGKMKYIIKKYDKQLGKKVLVICPPGNLCEIAKFLAKDFKGYSFTQEWGGRAQGHFEDTSKSLEKFKSDDTRFLFVVGKCQVGFDMPELCSVIDLTMSRNVKILAQRAGRIARLHGDLNKNYFYVYDQSVMKDRLEWLICTMIDFCLGHYDGWTTKTAKYKKTNINANRGHVFPHQTSLKEIIRLLRGNIHNKRTLRWVTKGGPPTIWTLKHAKAEAAKYESRTDLWSRRPALYKWFRLNAKDEMDTIFPIKNQQGKWNAETVEAVMKEHTSKMSRKDFWRKYHGMEYWINDAGGGKNKKFGRALLDKYFPRSVSPWTEARVKEVLGDVRHWSAVRQMGGLRGWMNKHANGRGEAYWRKYWMSLVPKAQRITVPMGRRPHVKKQTGTMRQRVLRNIRANKAAS